MKTFCPSCHMECMVTSDTARSTCCDQPAYVGCDSCGKRLVQLRVISVGPNPEPIQCYSCDKRSRKPKKKAVFA